jgi:hypothetical protein
VQKFSILSFAKISSSRYDRRIKVAELVRNLEDEKKSHELTKEQLNAAQLSIVNLNLEVTASQQLLSTAQERSEDSASEANGLRYRLSTALDKLADSNRRWASAAAATELPQKNDRQLLVEHIGVLNQLRCALVPSIPEFEIGSADLRTNVQSLVATTPANYFQVLNERDDYARANAVYARDLRSLRAEYYKLRVQIAKSD